MNAVDTPSVNNFGRLWAVVPAKRFAHAKSRLMPLLSWDERRTLSGAMLADVLSTLTRAPCLAGVMVVTSERELVAIARKASAVVISDDGCEGTESAAVAAAAHHLADMDQAGMLVIPADVPAITVEDVEAIARRHRAAPSVTLVPASRDRGTNALACSPPLAISCRFGDDSLRLHIETARAAGIDPRIVRLERVGLDIDRPDDLAEFLIRRSSTRSHAYLMASGIAQRVRDGCRSSAGAIEATDRA